MTATPGSGPIRAGSRYADENSCSCLTSSAGAGRLVIIVELDSFVFLPKAQQVATKMQTVHSMTAAFFRIHTFRVAGVKIILVGRPFFLFFLLGFWLFVLGLLGS